MKTVVIAGLRPDVRLVEMDTEINDPTFATSMADALHEMYQTWRMEGMDGAKPGA